MVLGGGPSTGVGLCPSIHPSVPLSIHHPPNAPPTPSPGRPVAAPLTHGSTPSPPLLLSAFLFGSLPPGLSSRSFPGKCTVSPVLLPCSGALSSLQETHPRPPAGPQAFSPRLAPLWEESAAFNPSGIALEDGI